MSACAKCDGVGSVPLHRRGCLGGEGCDCFTNVDIPCSECDGEGAAEVARRSES
jgi:RecJ-like exonuclease